MSNLDTVKDLWARTKAPNHTTESLTALLADYGQVLNTVMASGEDYKTGLRRQREEIQDLQRLITKRHDAVLKGRLQDAIGTLKRKVEEIEAPPVEAATPEQPGNTSTEADTIVPQEEPRRVRNMPTLGMD